MDAEPHPPARPGRSPVWRIVLLPALILTLANAVKPLHIDDTFLVRVAEQVAHNPADPYGFDIFWMQWPQPVNEELTPPVLPYWLAAGQRVVGGQPWVLKLWLFPFALLFALSWWALARRLAPGVEEAVVYMTLLSPLVLPGFNLMQDLPALALGSSALALFVRACERDTLWLAVAAGTIAGVAAQTKYTAVGFWGALVLWGLIRRRRTEAVVALSAALLVFFGWEWLMTLRYGKGMFLGQLEQDLYWVSRPRMALHLLRLVGALLAVPVCLGFPALGFRRSTALAASWLIVGAYGCLWFFPIQEPLYLGLGLIVSALLVAVTARSLTGVRVVELVRRRPEALFLAVWLVGEVTLYFATAPFPAVRRAGGIVLVGTLLLARQACLVAGPRRWVGGLALATVVLGSIHAAVDIAEARAQEQAVDLAAERIAEDDAGSEVWFLGHWGFQYYAEQRGWRPVIPDRSLLRRGDWLVVPAPVHRQEVRLHDEDLHHVATIQDGGPPRLTTGHGYYADSRPLRHLEGPRLETRIFRLERDLVPETSWSASHLAAFARSAAPHTAAAAVPALARELGSSDAAERSAAAQGLAAVGPLAAPAVHPLARALSDPDPRVRLHAAVALGRIGPAAEPASAALREAQQDADSAVRNAAVEALASLRNGKSR